MIQASPRSTTWSALAPALALRAALLAMPLLALAALPAMAQTRPTELSASQSLATTSTGIPPYNPAQSGTRAVTSGPTFRLFGVPIQVSAPVIAPYNQSAMQTLAGQPMLGKDAVIAQGMGNRGIE